MLDLKHFQDYVVRPVLLSTGMYSPAAENLVLGTALQESRLTYLHQLGGGPALGLYQMEPDTAEDIWDNYLEYRQAQATAVKYFMASGPDRIDQLTWNLAYATVMCRLHYWRVSDPLPSPTDVEGLANYWKTHYNTEQGAGTVEEFVRVYKQFMLPDST